MLPSSRRLALLALAFAAAALAGCLGGGESTSASVDVAGYEEALDAPGMVLDPVAGPAPVETKLLNPPSSSVSSPGTQPVVLLVHDPASGQPVEDAEVALEARMPAMGHGTGPESDPVHAGGGVYEGQTTWSMSGEWVLHLDVQLADGSTVSYEVEIAVGEHDEDPQPEPREPYGSFGEVMAAPGTVYEGQPLAPPTETIRHAENVTDPAYEHQQPVGLGEGHLEEVRVSASLQPGSPLDSLNVSLETPEGQPALSLQLTADAPEAEATLADPEPGEWQLDVSGNALEAGYEVEIHVVHEPQHVDVKTLDPADPTRAQAGDRPLLFAVFEAFGPEPITEATVNVTVRDAGGEVLVDEEATHEGAGQYRTASGLAADGEGTIEIDVRLPLGEAHRYTIAFGGER